MQNCIFFLTTLITDILRNARLIPKSADRIYKIPICPKLTSPKLLLHFRMLLENLTSRKVFQNCDDLSRTHSRYRLNQKMNMIFICAYFKKVNLISLLNLKTYRFQRLINSFTEYHFSIFCRTYKMIQKYTYIMRFMYIFALTHTYKDNILSPQAAGN